MATLLGMACTVLAQAEKAAKPAPAPSAAPAQQAAPPAEAAPAAKAAPAPKAAPADKAAVPPKAAPTAILVPPSPPGPPRKLAPGVFIAVDPQLQPEETVSRPDIVELLAVDPNYDFAKGVFTRRDIWWLEFQFKPVRMIHVDIPQPSGQMQRKLIWYLMYTVTNRGKALHPVRRPNGAYDIQRVDLPIRFAPSLLLESIGLDKRYPDRVIPVAMSAIQLREEPNRDLLNTQEMAQEIAVGKTLWGVATWEDIDPKTTKFAIYVSGLTNAYQWIDEPGRFKKGDPLGTGRYLPTKTLKLNFRRAGDEFSVKETQIRYGIPDGLDYEWVYR
jgi:hypothetical protein